MIKEITEEIKPTEEPEVLENVGSYQGEGGQPVTPTVEKMIVLYFLDDGEIHEVAYGYDSLESYYGPKRAPQFGQIIGGLVVQPSDYLFNQPQSFKVDVSDPHAPQLILTEQAFRLLEIFNRTKNLY